MKKSFLICLILLVSVIISSCGVSKSEMLKNASPIDMDEVTNECNENIVNAKEKHVGNSYKFLCVVNEINEKSIQIGDEHEDWKSTISIDKNEITELSENQYVEVVGKIESIEKSDGVVNFEIKNAHISKNTFISSGRLEYGYFEKTFGYATSNPYKKDIWEVRFYDVVSDNEYFYNYEPYDGYHEITKLFGDTFVNGQRLATFNDEPVKNAVETKIEFKKMWDKDDILISIEQD